MVKARVFGKRFCTYCGKTNMYYYTWEEEGKTRVFGECFTRGCENVDYCDNQTEEDIKKWFGDKLKPSSVQFVNLI